MNCSFQVQIRGGSKKEQCIECSSLCAVLCTIGFKIMSLVCIMIVQGYCMVVHIRLCSSLYMDCLQSLHGSVHLSIEDCCIEMHDGLFTVTA